MATCGRMEPYPYLSPYTKFYPRSIKILNTRPDAMTLIKNKLGNTLKLISTGDDFLYRTQVAQRSRPTIINLLHGIKKLLYSKRHCHSSKGTDYRKRKSLHQQYVCHRVNLGYTKNSTYYTSKINSAIKNWGMELNRAFSKMEYQ